MADVLKRFAWNYPRPGFSKKLLAALLAILTVSITVTSSGANVVPISCDGSTVQQCAIKVKTILADNATTPEEAVFAWGAWTDVYEKAYRGLANAPVPPTDLDRFESTIGDKIDSFTNPAQIALDLAIEKYFPRLATIIAAAEGPVAVALMTFLAPSPIVTPIQELQSTNDELSRLLWLKIGPWLVPDWRQQFNTKIQDALDGSTLPKP
ncbi:hypothetical protein GOD74_12115 [Sinorhizobium medicae]|nr:hypothetical protein [Sinorhizobium medicae]